MCQMAQGRGTAIVATVLLLGLLLHCENVWAASFNVGDAGGWSFNVDGWPNGKTFKAGDVLGEYETPSLILHFTYGFGCNPFCFFFLFLIGTLIV